MFKRAFVRGIQAQLVQNDRAVYPNEKVAHEVADYIADNSDFDPTTQMTYEKVAELANHLVDASSMFLERGQTPDGTAKTAAMKDFNKLAHETVIALMKKASEGSNYTGGDTGGNTTPTTPEGKMDLAARPEGYAHTGVGTTAVDTKPGAVGSETTQPAVQANSPAGSNSITEQRTASLRDAIRKLASGGSNYTGGDTGGNTTPNTPEGKMDLAARPEGYAHVARGTTAVNTATGAVGNEVVQPAVQANSPAGASSITAKVGGEDPFMALFRKTASEVNEYLPASMASSTKVAHVKRMMGLNTTEKAAYIVELVKVSGELPPWLAGKVEEKKPEDKKDDKDDNGKDKKPDEKKDDKDPKSEEKAKEAALLDIFKTLGR